MTSPVKIRCRLIEDADLATLTDLLARGFPTTDRQYWINGFDRLKTRARPAGYPDFGYLLEAEGVVVGVILLIFTQTEDASGPKIRCPKIRCNVSSWYVEPGYRGYATLLISQAQKLKEVTYLNVSAARHTWPVVEAQGYRRYSQGQMAVFPALSGGFGASRVRAFDPARDGSLDDFALLERHAAAGCQVLIVEGADGPEPFVFVRRKLAYAPFGVMQLIYCRQTAAFVRHAGVLGRGLLRRGVLCVLCDADGPVPGLTGWFFRDKAPRYFKGPERPRLNDLSDTEIVLFGL
jgi:hypothetical protein